MISVKTIIDTRDRQYFDNSNKVKILTTREISLESMKAADGFARIITGIRRCGKSSLLQLILRDDAFFLNFEDTSLYGFTASDFKLLNLAIKECTVQHPKCKTLCFDEIQIVQGWELFIHQKLSEGFLVYITGSNASLLSVELGTHLTGRHLDTELFPFSFTEFCTMKKYQVSEKAFTKYLETGGFPEFIKNQNSEILQNLFEDILIRDIAVRHSIRDVRTLKVLALYLISNCGNLITGTKLSAQLGLKTNVTILEYLSYLEKTYLFYYVPKFDFSLKAQSVNPKKVYCIDTGLIKNVTRSFTDDDGRIFENAVFMQIRRQTKNIWYYSSSSFECDFLYSRSLNALSPEYAVQVCYKLTPENQEREVRALVEVCKKFPSVKPCIVTLSQKDTISFENTVIQVVSAIDFFTT